ncbi:MAG: hypothetical protein HC904_09310 [Blastochloris sp.]|nr:hypothetical protein [Blastochloris sp.]
MADDCFVYAQKNWMRIFTRYPRQAENIAEGLMLCYRAKAEKEDPCFFLIKQTCCGIESEEIALTDTETQTEEQLTLFYGEALYPGMKPFWKGFVRGKRGSVSLKVHREPGKQPTSGN